MISGGINFCFKKMNVITGNIIQWLSNSERTEIEFDKKFSSQWELYFRALQFLVESGYVSQKIDGDYCYYKLANIA